MLAELTYEPWSRETYPCKSCWCARNPRFSWDYLMQYRQYPSLMSIQMMYLTWHQDLAFLGIDNVFHISVFSLRCPWINQANRKSCLGFTIGKIKRPQKVVRYQGLPHSRTRKMGRKLQFVLHHLRAALKSSIHSRWLALADFLTLCSLHKFSWFIMYYNM